MATNLREANRSWESLLTAHAVLMRRFAEEPVWRENGLSMREYDVLYTLSKCQKPARIGELQGGVLLSQPALSRLVDRLAERGLVQRSTDEEDRRAVRVALTDTGRELQRTVGRAHARSVERAMRVLSPAEQQTLAHLTRALATGPANLANTNTTPAAEPGPSATTNPDQAERS